MGLLRLVVAQEHTQNEVIEQLHMATATWIAGYTWRNRLTLFTLVEDEKGTDLMVKLNSVFNAGLIDRVDLEWGHKNRNHFKLRRIYRWKFPWPRKG